jgi:hypothetical protein
MSLTRTVIVCAPCVLFIDCWPGCLVRGEDLGLAERVDAEELAARVARFLRWVPYTHTPPYSGVLQTVARINGITRLLVLSVP